MTLIQIYPVLFLAIGLMVGAKLPDIDLTPALPIRHRSFWTHGPYLAVLVAWADVWYRPLHFVWLGLLVGLALHLIEDASPKSWRGSSHITLFPLPLSLNAFVSWLYILFSAALALWISVDLIGGH